MATQYFQNMKEREIPKGTYHVARWHTNGKLWISSEHYSADKTDALAEVAAWNAAPNHGGARQTPYFVWNHEEWLAAGKPADYGKPRSTVSEAS